MASFSSAADTSLSICSFTLSAGLNVRPMFGCGRILGYRRRMGWLEQLKKQKLAKYGHWKRRSEGLVMAVAEREVEGKRLPWRRRTAWLDDVRLWLQVDYQLKMSMALQGLWHTERDYQITSTSCICWDHTFENVCNMYTVRVNCHHVACVVTVLPLKLHDRVYLHLET